MRIFCQAGKWSLTMPRKPPANISIEQISAGIALAEHKTAPDVLDKQETEDIAAIRKKAEIQAIIESNEDKKANRLLRYKYAMQVYYYLVGYSVVCTTLLVLAGLFPSHFHLADNVLTTLVGSTGVSAIGLVGFVVNGLFKNH